MSVKRINVSNLELVRTYDEIPGNFTSVRGEYNIPQIGKTAFFKVNDCMIKARKDEDFRELFASKILDKINFPHAEILFAIDEKANRKGCLSVNVLNENEEFVGMDIEPKGRLSIEEFVEDNVRMASEINGITKEDLKNRIEYLIKYLFVSALINNSDLRPDNYCMIQNKENGKFRNPEYYDMGAAFLDDEHRKFFSKYTSIEIIKELYQKYSEQIKELGKNIEENLKINKIAELLNSEEYLEFPEETKDEIYSQTVKKLELIKELNKAEKVQYNNGKPEDSKNIKKEELSLAISEWSEGNSKLQEAISSCIQNGISTYASCKGHTMYDRPYLSMIITKDNLGKILNIINNVSDMKHIGIGISFFNSEILEGRKNSVLTIYSNMLNKNKVFETIADAAKSEVELQNCNEIVQNLWNFHKLTRTSETRYDLFNDVYFEKGFFKKYMQIIPRSQSFDLYQILQKQGLKKEKDTTLFYTKKDIKNTLLQLSKTLENCFEKDEKDEFFKSNKNKEKNAFKEELRQYKKQARKSINKEYEVKSVEKDMNKGR